MASESACKTRPGDFVDLICFLVSAICWFSVLVHNLHYFCIISINFFYLGLVWPSFEL